MSLVTLVLDVHRELAAARQAHAFGGALALAYIANPRATVDVDVNVFTPMTEIAVALDAFAKVALRPESDPADWLPAAGIRLRSEQHPYPVDVFPSLDARYEEVRRRCVNHPFGPDGVVLPFLSPEDLALFKLSFGRDKDWVDLRAIAQSNPLLDLDYIEHQLIGLRGPMMHPRIARLRSIVRATHR